MQFPWNTTSLSEQEPPSPSGGGGLPSFCCFPAELLICSHFTSRLLSENLITVGKDHRGRCPNRSIFKATEIASLLIY